MPTREEGAQLGDGVRRLVWVGRGGCRAGGRAGPRPPHAVSLRTGTLPPVYIHQNYGMMPEPNARRTRNTRARIMPVRLHQHRMFDDGPGRNLINISQQHQDPRAPGV